MKAAVVDSLRQALRDRSRQVASLPTIRGVGEVTDCVGLLVESQGPPASLGDLCRIDSGGTRLNAQVVGFRGGRALLMPLEEMDGMRPGATVTLRPGAGLAPAGEALLGRVIDAFGRPLDDKGPLKTSERIRIYSDPPGPLERRPIRERFVTGVRAIDSLLPCGKGQRVGVFGGSGVGKSSLLGAMARASVADVNVIALVGERNREVRAFLDDVLGDRALSRSVVIVATSDRPAPARVRAAFLAAAAADWFRSSGRDVLLIMDSVTRLAMAQREIGLATNEPPSQKGYTPSVFQMLPRVFERAGAFERGSITALYTVLVEGDDMDEPIADAARSLLDGHIVLSRELASANHYPAIDVLESISRLSRDVSNPEQIEWASRLRDSMASYRRSQDLINLGAYASGSNPKLDAAVASRGELEAFLRQDLSKAAPLDETLDSLQALASKL